MPAEDYGRFYYCVKVAPELSPDGEIYVYADHVTVSDGCLLLTQDKNGEQSILLAVAGGLWTAFFAASCLDGSAVAVEHWTGEVAR